MAALNLNAACVLSHRHRLTHSIRGRARQSLMERDGTRGEGETEGQTRAWREMGDRVCCSSPHADLRHVSKLFFDRSYKDDLTNRLRKRLRTFIHSICIVCVFMSNSIMSILLLRCVCPAMCVCVCLCVQYMCVYRYCTVCVCVCVCV